MWAADRRRSASSTPAKLRSGELAVSAPDAIGDGVQRGQADETEQSRNPWSVPVVVAQIPETGLHRDIEADCGRTRRDGRGSADCAAVGEAKARST